MISNLHFTVTLSVKLTPQDVSSTYDLFGVVYHTGDLGRGHYTARAVNLGHADGQAKWYNYNDSNVSEVRCLEVTTTERLRDALSGLLP